MKRKPTEHESRRRHLGAAAAWLLALGAILLPLTLRPGRESARAAKPANLAAQAPLTVLGYSELGMHCMNQDFSEMCVLPPYNTMFAEIVDRSGAEPRIVTSGVTVQYRIPGYTRSTDKTNFWSYAEALFGKPVPPNVGLAGNGLTGTMTPTADGRWEVVGVPMTPIADDGHLDAYQRMLVTVQRNGAPAGRTQPVVPVSWEMACNLCHNTPGISVATDILRAHDRRHGTTLEAEKPVLCARCHADPALGAPGATGVSTLSHAMHTAHAPRMTAVSTAQTCYACHPGQRTQCLRDVHYAKGLTCTDCHGSMLSVGSAARRPWQDEPRCGDCHQRAGYEFEQPGTLFRNSRGHRGIHCAACHGAPHAISPTVIPSDDRVTMNQQGVHGTIATCEVCHSTPPDDPFPHNFSTDN